MSLVMVEPTTDKVLFQVDNTRQRFRVNPTIKAAEKALILRLCLGVISSNSMLPKQVSCPFTISMERALDRSLLAAVYRY
ncbi:hypothetical protein JTE90_013443 [Oedothorax gibbosus]|uniref:MSP domain-containing protein n=1 Tax=Oedothorax gibbosus TaxID=931172 RepID=A0AAV6VMK2_9ARAC|nr:hypothetical protein JTE90_013443 [Oedothorax gibbosus]